MLCEKCKLRPASVTVMQTSDGKTKRVHLCNACAEEQAFFGDSLFGSFFSDPFFSSFFGAPKIREEEKINIFDYFSDRAQTVISKAENTAKKFGSLYIDTEHLLLGLLDDKVILKILGKIKLKPEKLKEELQANIKKEKPIEIETTLSPRAKKSLELAFEEARNFGHHYVGPEHILLGLSLEGEGLAAQTLSNEKTDYSKIKQAVVEQVGLGDEHGVLPQIESKTPTLDEFSKDLTKLAQEGKLDPVIGRKEEINRIIQILSRRTKNNPVLIGDPGVGKTAIAEGLAQRIAKGNVPEVLKNKRVVALDLSAIVAGTKYRGEFEERFKKVVEEILATSREIILFIDELHVLVGAGGAEGAIDASNMIKPPLARGDLQCIGATTVSEYRKYIEKDAALERRFQPVLVEEPSVSETIEILQGLRDKYEAHHRVKISDEAIIAAANLSDRYLTDRFLPDKAIDLIDEAAAKVRLSIISTPEDLKELEEKIKNKEREKEAVVKAQDFRKATVLKEEILKLKQEIEEKSKGWKKEKGIDVSDVTASDVAEIVSSWTKIPLTSLAEEESEKLLKLEKKLHQRVVGQDEAIIAVSEAIRRGRSGLKHPARPIGSFIFLGPTGVGKTELAKALACELFGSEEAMIRLDMSEYQEKHTVSRLIGAPPGYVGFEEGGQLTEAIRRKPYSVILLDEIEKAHSEVFNVLLQILDDGRLTDGKGKTIDFKNTVIIATSNLGAEMINSGLKKEQTEKEYEEMKQKLMSLLHTSFRPEFLNRIDEIIVFHPLTEKEIKEIITLQLSELKKKLQAQKISLEITDKVKEKIATEGFDAHFGARPLRRAIQKQIENPLSSLLIKGEFKEGNKIKVNLENGKIIFKKS